MTPDKSQQSAIDFALANRFAIVNGGAGTGKTTIIQYMAAQVRNPALCAFAGKAAARLKEATGHETSTIHRLLRYTGTTFRTTSLHGLNVIVDESSMIASDLLAEIVRREPASLTLVGDQAQLPPVGSGQPFHDLINIRPDRVRTLENCYRNSEAVFKAAAAIRNGEMPLRNDKSEKEQWDVLATGDPAETQRVILGWVKSGYLDFSQDIILCPRNGETEDAPCTVKGLNRSIVDLVNPRREEDEKFCVGDRVINTKNCSEKDVWNGTTGTIHAIDQDGQIWVKLDIPIKDYDADLSGEISKDMVQFDKKMAKELQLAYALTVHKSQGSQYRRVVFCCLNRDSHTLLGRSLIYTAITRTETQCAVVGNPSAFQQGINRVNHKRTVIQELATR